MRLPDFISALPYLAPSTNSKPNPRIGMIEGTTFKENCFGQIGPLNTTFDFGWISSGDMVPYLEKKFGAYVGSRQKNYYYYYYTTIPITIPAFKNL